MVLNFATAFRNFHIVLACLATTLFIGAQSNPCGNGWVLGPNMTYCYHIDVNLKSWNDANQSCVEMSGNLLSINSQEENEFIFYHTLPYLLSKKGYSYWIGLHNLTKEGYVWSDNTSKDFESWARLEAKKGRDVRKNPLQPCVFFYNRKWYKAQCKHKFASICKKKNPDPSRPKPPPFKPCNKGSPHDGWFLGNSTYFCYKPTKEKLDWTSAAMYCQSSEVKGFLASIQFEADNKFIMSLQKYMKIKDIWIGLYKLIENGGKKSEFVWLNGDFYDYYKKWAPANLTSALSKLSKTMANFGGYEGYGGCVQQYGESGYWDVNSCSQKFYGVCGKRNPYRRYGFL